MKFTIGELLFRIFCHGSKAIKPFKNQNIILKLSNEQTNKSNLNWKRPTVLHMVNYANLLLKLIISGSLVLSIEAVIAWKMDCVWCIV